jgi:hypothetical protein
MPLYYFDVHGDETIIDEDGIDLDDARAARAFAVRTARLVAADSVRRGHLVKHHRVEILGEDRKLLGEVRLGEAVEIRP